MSKVNISQFHIMLCYVAQLQFEAFLLKILTDCAVGNSSLDRNSVCMIYQVHFLWHWYQTRRDAHIFSLRSGVTKRFFQYTSKFSFYYEWWGSPFITGGFSEELFKGPPTPSASSYTEVFDNFSSPSDLAPHLNQPVCITVVSPRKLIVPCIVWHQKLYF